MHRHPFQPASAILGLAAVLAGIVVAFGHVADLDGDATGWLAGAALLAGLAIIPWRRCTTGGVPAEEVESPASRSGPGR